MDGKLHEDGSLTVSEETGKDGNGDLSSRSWHYTAAQLKVLGKRSSFTAELPADVKAALDAKP